MGNNELFENTLDEYKRCHEDFQQKENDLKNALNLNRGVRIAANICAAVLVLAGVAVGFIKEHEWLAAIFYGIIGFAISANIWGVAILFLKPFLRAKRKNTPEYITRLEESLGAFCAQRARVVEAYSNGPNSPKGKLDNIPRPATLCKRWGKTEKIYFEHYLYLVELGIKELAYIEWGWVVLAIAIDLGIAILSISLYLLLGFVIIVGISIYFSVTDPYYNQRSQRYDSREPNEPSAVSNFLNAITFLVFEKRRDLREEIKDSRDCIISCHREFSEIKEAFCTLGFEKLDF